MESLTARDTEKIEIFSHSHADPDVYDFLSSDEHKFFINFSPYNASE